jgi:hypothetical protein
VGAEQERVLEGGKAEGKEGVEPESNGHARDSPGTVGVVGFVCLDDVFLRSRDDGSDREDALKEPGNFVNRRIIVPVIPTKKIKLRM